MIEFTEAARRKLFEIAANAEPDDQAKPIRVRAQKGPSGLRYSLDFDAATQDDHLIDLERIRVAVDPQSAELLEGAKIHFVEKGPRAGGFQFLLPPKEDAPKPPPPEPTEDTDHALLGRAQEVFEEHINPAVAAHGGFIQLVNVVGDELFIRMGGGCQGCASSTATLRQGVETLVKAKLPEVATITDLTDHARGENPYYDKQAGATPAALPDAPESQDS
ncbi:MAG: NifU family protein [Planctomycetota bacterium]